VPTRTGTTTGLRKNCKVGDLVVELGADCVAAGEKFVVEAKEDASYTAAKALVDVLPGTVVSAVLSSLYPEE
jgi:uridine phosphorylase